MKKGLIPVGIKPFITEKGATSAVRFSFQLWAM